MAIIETRSLSKTYVVGGVRVPALDDVSLSVGEGRFVAVIGASGSGKSTLLNLLGGLDTPSAGTIEIDGALISAMDREALARYRRHGAGMIFQSFNLVPARTALENVELPLYYGPLPLAEQPPRARAALARVGIAHRADHLPSQLSGGEQQRVAIARALVGEPDLILADEPTGNLDSKTSMDIMTMLRDLNRTTGVTLVIVTHDPEVAAVADRVIAFRDGRIVGDTRPSPRRDESAS